MPNASDRLRELLREFKRRSVYRVGAIYLASLFVVLQGASLLLPAGLLGDTGYRLLTVAGVLGLPVALVLAWAFDITPDGIRRADAGPPLGRALRWGLVGAVVLVTIAAGFVAWRLGDPERGAIAQRSTSLVAAGYDPARIAVLYFDDHSPERELGYLADGLTEDLIHDLAQTSELKVVSRNGVKLFRGAAVTADSIGRALGVGTFIEGSVTRSGDWIRVTAQLIDAETGMHLDSRMVERPIGELFALQDELRGEIGRSIRRRLGIEVRLFQRRSETTSLESWTLLQQAEELRGRMPQIWREDDAAGLLALARADSLLAQAARHDPEWARPVLVRGWNEYSRALYTGPRPGTPVREPLLQGLQYAEQALRLAGEARAEPLELRGTLSLALARLGEGTERDSLMARAERDLRTATLDDPRLARAWWTLAELLRVGGRFAEARRDAQRALDEDAFLEDAPRITQMLFHTAFEQRDHDEAQRWCLTGRARFPTNEYFVICQLLFLASAEPVPPDTARARALGDTLEAMSPPPDRAAFRAYADMQLAKVFARVGVRDSAHALIRRAHGDTFQGWLGYDEAHTRLLLDERDLAIDLLTDYLERNPGRRSYWPGDWWLEKVWDDPRFIALVRDAD